MPSRFILLLLAVATYAHAGPSRTLPPLEIHATIDKRDALLSFDTGAVAATINPDELDSISATTSDFAGGPLPAVIVLHESVTEARLQELANYQGRLKGTVQCKRVRVSNSPQFPKLKMTVLAEQCTIKTLQH